MGFMDAIKQELLESDSNVSITENGAVGYKSTGKNLLDMNFKVASYRKASEEVVIGDFEKAFTENPLLAMKWLMFCRDAREGLGERKTPRIILRNMAKVEPEIVRVLIPLIPYYGRFDDLLVLIGTKLETDLMEFIKVQLDEDRKNKKAGKPISLLAKWLPSENASSKQTKENARVIRNRLNMSAKTYRMMLSELRKYLNVVETKMSAKEWGEIDYSAVPSRANLIYNGAFIRNDEERRRAYLEALKKGETKMNVGTLFPHEVVHKYGCYPREVDDSYEAMWNDLPDLVKGNSDSLFVRDGSGSMTCTVDPKSSVTALEVATGLAIYFSEKCAGEFKDKFITFSANPKLVDLSGCKDLAAKIRRCYREDDCSNTNIEKTFDLILNTAVSANMSQEDLPKNVVIVSDMEFDSISMKYDYNKGKYVSAFGQNLFKNIAKKFEAKGYKLPRLIFWNVNSRTATIPLRENEMGVALVSGFSANICKMVLSGKLDPFEALLEQINAERYEPVAEALKKLL